MEMKRDPIIVGCCGSSGSSLLATFLTNHREIFCGPELALFSKKEIYKNFEFVKKQFSSWWENGIESPGPMGDRRFMTDYDQYHLTEEFLFSEIYNNDNLNDFVYAIADRVLKREHKTVFVEKTPANCYCFEDFLKVFPTGKVIHIVRDGRDVVSSLMNRGYPFYMAIARWLCDVNAGLSCSHSNRYIQLRYEDLVRNTEFELKKICKKIGLNYDPGMLEREQYINRKRCGMDSWTSKPTSDPINTRSVGRYKKRLREVDLQYFYRMKLSKDAAKAWNLKLSSNSTSDLLRDLKYKDIDNSFRTFDPYNFYRYSVEIAKRYFRRDKLQSGVIIPIRYSM